VSLQKALFGEVRRESMNMRTGDRVRLSIIAILIAAALLLWFVGR
jgi:hypothetical protein